MSSYNPGRPGGPDVSEETLSFRVSTDDLNAAIEKLRAVGGLAVWPEAWQVFVNERTRREMTAAPAEIRLARSHFDALPPVVKRLLLGELG
jgi:hypothetical protein